MNNKEIASRIRNILYYSNEIYDTSGHLDFATNHTRMVSMLTELLLDIINAPKR